MAQVAGLPLLLPAYARPDLGFELDVAVPGGVVDGNGQRVLWTSGGLYVDVPLTVVFVVVTAVGITNRTVTLALTNDGGTVLWRVPAPAQQPAATVYTYTWSPLLVAAVGPSGGFTFATPYPPSMMFPGYQLLADLATGAGTSNLSGVAVGVQRYPTGPRPETTFAPVPTPLQIA